MKRKILSIAIIIALLIGNVFILTGCGKEENKNQIDTNKSVSEESTDNKQQEDENIIVSSKDYVLYGQEFHAEEGAYFYIEIPYAFVENRYNSFTYIDRAYITGNFKDNIFKAPIRKGADFSSINYSHKIESDGKVGKVGNNYSRTTIFHANEIYYNEQLDKNDVNTWTTESIKKVLIGQVFINGVTLVEPEQFTAEKVTINGIDFIKYYIMYKKPNIHYNLEGRKKDDDIKYQVVGYMTVAKRNKISNLNGDVAAAFYYGDFYDGSNDFASKEDLEKLAEHSAETFKIE